MKNKNNPKARKEEGDMLGGKQEKKKLAQNPAPIEDTRESETTPPGNEIYVDLEPDELHLEDTDVTETDEKEK